SQRARPGSREPKIEDCEHRASWLPTAEWASLALVPEPRGSESPAAAKLPGLRFMRLMGWIEASAASVVVPPCTRESPVGGRLRPVRQPAESNHSPPEPRAPGG